MPNTTRPTLPVNEPPQIGALEKELRQAVEGTRSVHHDPTSAQRDPVRVFQSLAEGVRSLSPNLSPNRITLPGSTLGPAQQILGLGSNAPTVQEIGKRLEFLAGRLRELSERSLRNVTAIAGSPSPTDPKPGEQRTPRTLFDGYSQALDEINAIVDTIAEDQVRIGDVIEN